MWTNGLEVCRVHRDSLNAPPSPECKALIDWRVNLVLSDGKPTGSLRSYQRLSAPIAPHSLRTLTPVCQEDSARAITENHKLTFGRNSCTNVRSRSFVLTCLQRVPLVSRFTSGRKKFIFHLRGILSLDLPVSATLGRPPCICRDDLYRM